TAVEACRWIHYDLAFLRSFQLHQLVRHAHSLEFLVREWRIENHGILQLRDRDFENRAHGPYSNADPVAALPTLRPVYADYRPLHAASRDISRDLARERRAHAVRYSHHPQVTPQSSVCAGESCSRIGRRRDRIPLAEIARRPAPRPQRLRQHRLA